MPQQTTHQELIPGFRIRIDGADLASELVPQILSVEVDQYVDGADAFTIGVNIWDSQTQDFQWLDDGTFAEGRALEILAGYGEDLQSLIRGEIVALEVEYGSESSPVLHVQGYDRLHRLRRGRRTRTYVNIKDSEVAERIAREMQLQAQTDDSGLVHAHLFQCNQSPLDFLQERARRIDYEVDVSDGTLYFRRRASGRGKTLTLQYRDDLKQFTVRLSTQTQVKRIVVRGWDPLAKEPIVGLGQAGDEISAMGGSTLGVALAEQAFGESQELVADRPVFSQNEADRMAKGLFNRMSLQFLKGEGEAIGNALLRAGEVVEIGKLGRRLSGNYYLTRVQHIIDGQGYRTCIECHRNSVV
jgi:uncharacterized protein